MNIERRNRGEEETYYLIRVHDRLQTMCDRNDRHVVQLRSNGLLNSVVRFVI